MTLKILNMLRLLTITITLISLSSFSIAQSGSGSIRGTVIDERSGDPVPYANIALKVGGSIVLATTTNFDGKYSLKPIQPGKYDVEISYVGFSTSITNGVVVNANSITFHNVRLQQGSVEVGPVIVTEYIIPVFKADEPGTIKAFSEDDIKNMAVRNPISVAKASGNGMFSRDDGTNSLSSKGGRPTNNITYLDGIKLIGAPNIPASSIGQISVQSGGIPAEYGDVTGAVTTITTKGGLRSSFVAVDFLTSGFKVSDKNVVGLDKFGYNSIDISAGGPIIKELDDSGSVTRVPLGYLISGQFSNVLNPRPSAVQLYKPNDNVEQLIQNDPFFTDGINPGVFKRTEFLTNDDFEEIDFQRNVKSQNIVMNGKFDISLNENCDLAVGGTFNRTVANTDIRSFQLYNYFNNPLSTSQDIRAYGRYTFRFSNPSKEEDLASSKLDSNKTLEERKKEEKSVIKNAYFTVQADFSRRSATTEDERHENNFFKYGYIGRFNAITEASYAYTDNNRQGVLLDDGNYYFGDFLTAFNSPIAYNFTPSEVNPILSNYTSSFYQFRDQFPDFYTTRENVEGFGGLVNGSSVSGNVYNLWSAPGQPFNSYSKIENDQYRISGKGSAEIGDHAITLGFEYEQRVQRNYSLNPLALWQLGRGSVNSHITEIDSSSYLITQEGSDPRITFDRAYAGDSVRTYFAYNMRKALGLPVNGTDFIDFDSYDIDLYKLDYFSAEQLINPVNNVNLQYRGYDYLGNKTAKIPSLDDFFNETNDLGFKTRPVAPYQPIYIAGYIEDKFVIEDFIFRLGVRLDRFDANQPVLKDQFSFFPTRDAAFARNQGGEIPSNIGDDYVVYVSDIENPASDKIVGFRDPETNTFYNASGEQLNSSAPLEAGGGIAPWLIDPLKRSTTTDMSSESFKDYEAQYIFMPRISFSFPISEEATFFANYDILTQRPTGNVALDPIDLIFVQNHNRILNNPELKPTKTISYELGFKQKLSNSSALSLTTFYREQRDEIQVIRLDGAYPENYLTYSNQDFGTVKGFIVSYDLRRTKNISLGVNYTIQFAEGTGSGSTSSLNLVNSGQPNLRSIFPYSFDQRHQITTTFDYRFGKGKSYDGPIIKERKILENTGFNVVFLAGSGTPYTARSLPTNSESLNPGQRAPIIGDINGSRLPWTLRMDARLDKTFHVKWNDESKKSSTINVYLQVLNLLNRQNIQSVYGYTGNPDDDGYLTSALFQDVIRQQLSEESFRDQYSMRLQNMYNYELPRRMRLGVQVNF